jgi:hypothetical protein
MRLGIKGTKIDLRTLGSFVRPLTGHSLIFSGVLIEQALACCAKGSLIMLTVKPFPDLILLVVSLIRARPLVHAIESVGGSCVTILNQLDGDSQKCAGTVQLNRTHLNGARFSTPSLEIVETKAIGLGTIPLIISWYSALISTMNLQLNTIGR